MKRADLMAGLALAMAGSTQSEAFTIEDEYRNLRGNIWSNGLIRQHEHGIFIPKKHTKMSYAKQNRLAKKRRNRSMYATK